MAALVSVCYTHLTLQKNREVECEFALALVEQNKEAGDKLKVG